MAESLPDLLIQLRATAEPTRLRLLAICAQGEMTVGEIAEVLGQSQPRVSRHLKVLCDAGLLVRFREQHWVFYRVPPTGEPAELVHALLMYLDPNDARLALDRGRTEAIKAERARKATSVLDQMVRQWPYDDTAIAEAVDEAIVAALSDQAIGDLLDIGTGTGRILKLLAPRADQAVGIDISSEMRLVARANLHAAGLDHCMIRHANMYRLPFPNRSFDTVTIDQVLYDAEDPPAAITEAARLLKPVGRLLLVEFTGGAMEAPVHRLDDAMVTGWLSEAGLSCENRRKVKRGGAAATVFLARRATGYEEQAA